MTGDLIGADAIETRRHASGALAVSISEIIVLPLTTITAFGAQHEGISAGIFRALGDEINRRNDLTIALGSLSAERRIARFLLC